MRKKILLLLISLTVLFLLWNLSPYKMINMLGEDNINVTYWVVFKKYKPHYCNGQIDKLINPSPHIFSKQEKQSLHEKLQVWVNSKQLQGADIRGSINSIEYQYSYFMDYNPVDVYSLNVVTSQYSQLFIRHEKGEFLYDFNESGWVTNGCK